MRMKGISTVIATILMVMITIALAVATWGFIGGWWVRTAGVVLVVTDQTCPEDIIVYVRNDGTERSGKVTVHADKPDGTSLGNCTIDALGPGGDEKSCTISRPAGSPTGPYSLRVSSPGAQTVKGITVYCRVVP